MFCMYYLVYIGIDFSTMVFSTFGHCPFNFSMSGV